MFSKWNKIQTFKYRDSKLQLICYLYMHLTNFWTEEQSSTYNPGVNPQHALDVIPKLQLKLAIVHAAQVMSVLLIPLLQIIIKFC